jgi:hypothetical protein
MGGAITGNTSPLGSSVNGVVDTADVTCRGYFPDGNYSNTAPSPHCPAIVYSGCRIFWHSSSRSKPRDLVRASGARDPSTGSG